MSALLGLLACIAGTAARAAQRSALAPSAALTANAPLAPSAEFAPVVALAPHAKLAASTALRAHERLELRVLHDPERILVRVHVEPEQPAILLVGDPWRGTEGFDPVRPARRVLQPKEETRARGWELPIDPAHVRAGVLELEVPGEGFGEQPVAVQAFGLGRRAIDAPAWSSPAFVIERADGALRVRSFRAFALARDGGRALLVAGALAFAVCAYAYARRASGTRARSNPRLALAAAALLVLVAAGWRVAREGTLSDALYAGAAPPLVWPGDWPPRGERSPLVLGAPFAELCAAIERELRPGERLTVHYAGAGNGNSGILRFGHLAALFPGTRVLLASHVPLAPGLHACVDFEPSGTPLFRNEAGALMRIEPAREDAR